MLAWLDGATRPSREADANTSSAVSGEFGPFWRGLSVLQGLAGRPTPTRAAPSRENTGLVGVACRCYKALREGPRQHGRRRHGKFQSLLAWLVGAIRLCGKAHANTSSAGKGNSRPCWRGLTVQQGLPGRPTPTRSAPSRENPGLVGVACRCNKALQGGRRQHGRRRPELDSGRVHMKSDARKALAGLRASLHIIIIHKRKELSTNASSSPVRRQF